MTSVLYNSSNSDAMMIIPVYGGWYHISVFYQLNFRSFALRISIDLGAGFDGNNVLVIRPSLKDNLNEVIRLPNGVKRIAIEFNSATEFDDANINLRPLTAIEARWRMLRRVLPFFWKLSRERWNSLSLNLRNLILDLYGCYQRVSLLRGQTPHIGYQDWIETFDTLNASDKAQIFKHIDRIQHKPHFKIILIGDNGKDRDQTIASLNAQFFRNFSVVDSVSSYLLDDTTPNISSLSAQNWVFLLRAGDILAPHALYWFALRATSNPRISLLYADEDLIDATGHRHSPQFKPDWSWSHARSTPFFGEAVAIREAALLQAGGLSDIDLKYGWYDAVLRSLDAIDDDTPCIDHISSILLHRSDRDRPMKDQIEWSIAAVRRHLDRRGINANVQTSDLGYWRVKYDLSEHPLVSIIIPTRNALDLTRNCVESLRRLTLYANYEIILVDNQSDDPLAVSWMRDQENIGALKLLKFNKPFNYSAMNNYAASEAKGELICFLNNDIEIITADWLDELVSHILQPGAQIVGAKLLYPDGSVQHAGDLLGIGGLANHAFNGIDSKAAGYCNRAMVTQEYSAVTAACLLIKKKIFNDVGKFDEKNLPVAFNDVDLCLRVRAMGGKILWTPHATLIHHESATRGNDKSQSSLKRAAGEVRYMRRKWKSALIDPFYNPNLSQDRADFSLNRFPVISKPWLQYPPSKNIFNKLLRFILSPTYK